MISQRSPRGKNTVKKETQVTYRMRKKKKESEENKIRE
jgi:hypothetical protein